MVKSKRTTYIIAAFSLIVFVLALYFLFIFQKKPKDFKEEKTTGEVKELSELSLEQKPFVTLTPTSDGAEIIISIENMGNFERIEYELTYLADNPENIGQKLTRGSTGVDVNTKEPKYKKSILLGTASRGVRNPDTGVTEGKLTLHLFKGETEYLSETDWDFFEVGKSTTVIKDRQGNFELLAPSFAKNYWVILTDTVGVAPKANFATKNIITPIYGTFSIAPKFTKEAKLSIKIAGDVKNPQLYLFDNHNEGWEESESMFNTTNKTISANIAKFATFVVVSSE